MNRDFGYKIPTINNSLFNVGATSNNSSGLATAFKSANKGNFGGVSNMYNIFNQTADLLSTLSSGDNYEDQISKAALNHDEGTYNYLRKQQSRQRVSNAEKGISTAMSVIMSIVMMAL